MGCPLDIVNDKQAGAALMMRESKLRESLLGMSRSLSCPFTVKMRTGWEEEKPFAHLLVPKIQSWKIEGLNALMVRAKIMCYLPRVC
jgi:tRNA-dihydrouridine synthase 3